MKLQKVMSKNKMKKKLTSEVICKEQERVFDEMFTIHDIRVGNTIEMHEEARKIAIKNLKK